jgi:hypothetical protein
MFFAAGGRVSPEEVIAHKLYGAYGAGALDQAMTCASLARVMADRPSTGIWNRVIAILTEREATARETVLAPCKFYRAASR